MKKSKYFLDYLNLKKIKYELCRNHIRACQNHNTCENYTLRVKITIRVKLTLCV
jgi:hypothetical protein